MDHDIPHVLWCLFVTSCDVNSDSNPIRLQPIIPSSITITSAISIPEIKTYEIYIDHTSIFEFQPLKRHYKSHTVPHIEKILKYHNKNLILDILREEGSKEEDILICNPILTPTISFIFSSSIITQIQDIRRQLWTILTIILPFPDVLTRFIFDIAIDNYVLDYFFNAKNT